ncbi:MAG TPA: c-type cytochrome [Dinghuibacter sp.]|uniref:c-type cytochrome n=1 Tax=Dinghuibacter sp. TaxID=2024697 RepID=UPI002C8B6267|nr:c-type cytochrome [Dinghuibacter sp.]HTJ11524.1 c-type cytochrome [Dinghuibacter sp.]
MQTTTIPKKSLGIVVALVLTAVCVSAFTLRAPQQHKRNLKVLPENISRDSLDMIMDHFKMALGVKCGFCHAQSTTNPGHLDFASDDKPEKEIARKMMIMTNDINQKYMRFNDDTTKGEAVSCITCHRGDPHPEVKYEQAPPPPPSLPAQGSHK